MNYVLGVNSSLVDTCLAGNLHKIGDTGEMVTGTALKTNSSVLFVLSAGVNSRSILIFNFFRLGGLGMCKTKPWVSNQSVAQGHLVYNNY